MTARNFDDLIYKDKFVINRDFARGMVVNPSEANWRSKSFVVALRSKSYNKDWEQTARPEPAKMFNFYQKVLAKGLAQIKIINL